MSGFIYKNNANSLVVGTLAAGATTLNVTALRAVQNYEDSVLTHRAIDYLPESCRQAVPSGLHCLLELTRCFDRSQVKQRQSQPACQQRCVSAASYQ